MGTTRAHPLFRRKPFEGPWRPPGETALIDRALRPRIVCETMILSLVTPRLGRVLVASLALVANLTAAGIPVLHAWAHEVADAHHADGAVAETVDHSHDEVHPEALHTDCLVAHRVAFDFALALPMQPPELVAVATEATLSVHPVAPMSSRAPPSPRQARAPPLV